MEQCKDQCYDLNSLIIIIITHLLDVATTVTTSLDKNAVNKVSQSYLNAFCMNSSESLNSIVFTCLLNISVFAQFSRVKGAHSTTLELHNQMSVYHILCSLSLFLTIVHPLVWDCAFCMLSVDCLSIYPWLLCALTKQS